MPATLSRPCRETERGPEGNRLAGALAIVMRHGAAQVIPELRALETDTSALSWQSCPVLGGGWSHGFNRIRALASLALLHVGEDPGSGGNYGFRLDARRASDAPAAGARAAPPRAWDIARGLEAGMAGSGALAQAGPPDFIWRKSLKVDRYYVWSEIWEYDGPDTTTRVVWSFPESSHREQDDRPRHVVQVEDVPEGWRKTQRLLGIVGLAY